MCRGKWCNGGRRCTPNKAAANARRKANRKVRKKLSTFFKEQSMNETSKVVMKSPPSNIPYIVDMLKLDGVISAAEMPGIPNYQPDLSELKAALQKDDPEKYSDVETLVVDGSVVPSVINSNKGKVPEYKQSIVKDTSSDDENVINVDLENMTINGTELVTAEQYLKEHGYSYDDENRTEDNDDRFVIDPDKMTLNGERVMTAEEYLRSQGVSVEKGQEEEVADVLIAIDDFVDNYNAKHSNKTAEDEYVPVGRDKAVEDEYIPVGRDKAVEDEYVPVGRDKAAEDEYIPVGGKEAVDEEFEPGDKIINSDDIEELDKEVSQDIAEFNSISAGIESISDYGEASESIKKMSATIGSMFSGFMGSKLGSINVDDFNEEQIDFLKNTSPSDYMKIIMSFKSSKINFTEIEKALKGIKDDEDEKEAEKEPDLSDFCNEYSEKYKNLLDEGYKVQKLKKENITIEESSFSEGSFGKLAKMIAKSGYHYSRKPYTPLSSSFPSDTIDSETKQLFSDMEEKGIKVKVANSDDDEIQYIKASIHKDWNNIGIMFYQLNKDGEQIGNGSFKSISYSKIKEEGYMEKTFGWLTDEKKVKNEFSKLTLASPAIHDNMLKSFKEDSGYAYHTYGIQKLNNMLSCSMYNSKSTKLKPKVSDTSFHNKDDIVSCADFLDEDNYSNSKIAKEIDKIATGIGKSKYHDKYGYGLNNGYDSIKKKKIMQAKIAQLSVASADLRMPLVKADKDDPRAKDYKKIGMNLGAEKYIPRDNVKTVVLDDENNIKNYSSSVAKKRIISGISDDWTKKTKISEANGITSFADYHHKKAGMKVDLPSYVSKSQNDNFIKSMCGDGEASSFYRSELSENINTAINDYTGSSYRRINDVLSGADRKGQNARLSGLTATYLAAISENLYNGKYADEANHRGKPVTTFRGMEVYGDFDPSSFQPGDVLEADRFTSTSVRGSVAAKFGGSASTAVRFVITSDKVMNLGDEMSLGNEKEVIIPKGANLVIARKEQVEDSNGVVLHLIDKELLEKGVKPDYLE